MSKTLGTLTNKIISSINWSIGSDHCTISTPCFGDDNDGYILINSTGYNKLWLVTDISTATTVWWGTPTATIEVYDNEILILSESISGINLKRHIDRVLNISSNQIKIRGIVYAGGWYTASSITVFNKPDHSYNNLLRNIIKTFVSGNTIPWTRDLQWTRNFNCAVASAASHHLLSYKNMDHRCNCEGVILNAEGYDGFELNAYGASHGRCTYPGSGYPPWEPPSYGYYNHRIFVKESNDINGPFTDLYESNSVNYILLPINKKYIKICSHIIGTWFCTGSVGITQASSDDYLFFTVKTPEGYPVLNATVKLQNIKSPQSIISSPKTDAKGTTKMLVNRLGYDNIKAWAEKTINKNILNLTAKEISELKEINVDEP